MHYDELGEEPNHGFLHLIAPESEILTILSPYHPSQALKLMEDRICFHEQII